MSCREKKLRSCIIPYCHGKRYDLVHKFPMDKVRSNQWLEIINLPELFTLDINILRRRLFVCSKHFRIEDYKNIESRSLNKTAVPSLYLGERSCSESVDDQLGDILEVTEPTLQHIDSNPVTDLIIMSQPTDNRLQSNNFEENINLSVEPQPYLINKHNYNLEESVSTNVGMKRKLVSIHPVAGNKKLTTSLKILKYEPIRAKKSDSKKIFFDSNETIKLQPDINLMNQTQSITLGESHQFYKPLLQHQLVQKSPTHQNLHQQHEDQHEIQLQSINEQHFIITDNSEIDLGLDIKDIIVHECNQSKIIIQDYSIGKILLFFLSSLLG